MAKVNSGLPVKEAKPSQVQTTSSQPPVVETAAGSLSITVPTVVWESGYARRSIDVRLTESQAMTLKAIQIGLEQNDAQLRNGKHVANATDAIRWMLENAK